MHYLVFYKRKLFTYVIIIKHSLLVFKRYILFVRDSAGLPVGVQVMTSKWKDELCLYVMSEIEKEVGFTGRPQFKP